MSHGLTWTILPAQSFTEHTKQWDALNQASANSMLLDSDFVAPLLTHFAEGKEKLAICGPVEEPLAMAIIVKTSLGQWTTFQPSQAPVGIWLQMPKISTAELCRSLRKQIPGLTLSFSITQQDPQLLTRFDDCKVVQTLDYIETAKIPVTGSFEDYWAQRGKNLRQGLKRQRNRLNREEVETRLEQLSAADDMREAVTAYGNMESAGWKAATNTAVHIDNAQGQFYLEMLQRFCRRGLGVVYRYYYNDQLVATDLCIKDSENIIILKTTYDENIKTSSPTMLMRQEIFSEIFSQQDTRNIEFYGKLMDWHTKWSKDIRTMYHVNHYTTPVARIKSLVSSQRAEPAPSS